MTHMDGRTAIVTGAGGGIGSATAKLLASRGARIVAADIVIDGAQRTADAIKQAGGEALALKVDIGEEREIAAMIAAAMHEFGRIDVLHNNAADLSSELHGRDSDVASMTVEVWDEAFRINVRGTMLCCKHVLPHMAAARRGSIINMASTMGLRGTLRSAAYSASKAAIMQLTRSVAATHGKHGIRCNSVAPGITLSDTVKNRTPAKALAIMESETLLPNLTEPEHIAGVVAFLASDDAANVTGVNIVVDGGMTAAGGIGQMRALAAGKG